MLVGLLRTARPCCQWWRRGMPWGVFVFCFVLCLCCLSNCSGHCVARHASRGVAGVAAVCLAHCRLFPSLCSVVQVHFAYVLQRPSFLFSTFLSRFYPCRFSFCFPLSWLHIPFPFPSSLLSCLLLTFFGLKQAPQETKGSGFPNSVRQPWELQNDRGTWRAGFLCTGEVCRARNSCGRASFRLSMPWELTHALVTSSGRGGSSSSSCSSGGGSSSFSNGSRIGAPIALLVVAFGN